MLTKERRDKLRKLATRALPGTWITARTLRHHGIECGDSDFMAAANPATVIALLDYIDNLESLLAAAVTASEKP